MKKFLKVFIIVLLVLGVIGGTAFFFFRNIKEKNTTTGSLAVMLQGESKLKFNASLREIETYVNSDGTDDRMDLIISTSEKLDSVVGVLSTYYIENNTKIHDEKISDKFNEVKESRNLLSKMIAEYKIKKDSPMFNRHLGANDLYEQSCKYLTQYAELAKLINGNLKVDRTSDLRFNMFEVYSNVVINTFISDNIHKDVDTYTQVINSVNLNIMNSVLKIRDLYIVKIQNENAHNEVVTPLFDANINSFNIYYSKCNKGNFAKNLSEYLGFAQNEQQPTNERKAAYYFNLIYGI